MDAIVPANNTALITNDSDRHHSYRHHDGKAADILNRISTASENIMNNDNSNAHAASATAQRVGFAGIDHTNQNGVEGRLVTNQNSSEGRLVTNQNSAEIRGSVERNAEEARSVAERFGLANMAETRKEGFETRDDVEKFGFRTQDVIERFGLKNLEATKDALKDVLVNTKDDLKNLLISQKDDLKNVLISQKDDLKDVLISQKNDFRDVMLKSCQVEKDMLLQFKDAQLTAEINKASLQAQIAKCCCENEMLVKGEADRTRELIRAESEARVRDDLRKTQDELVALRIRASLAPAPIAATAL